MNIIVFLILGLLTSLLFPPYFLLPLGFIIFPYLCYFLENKINEIKKFEFFLIKFFFSFGLFISFLFWIKDPFFVFDETKNFFFLAIFLIILLSLIYSIIFVVIFNIIKTMSVLLIVPIILVVIEFVISKLLYGFPWISFSLIISSSDYLFFTFKNFGTFVTSYLVIQIFCLPYLLFEKKITYYKIKIYLLIVLSPLTIIFFTNFIFNKNNNSDLQIIDLEIFQLNFKNDNNNLDPEKRFEIINQHLNTSDSSILIFAENNYPYLIKNRELVEFQKKIKKNQTLIIGGTRLDKNKYYNTFAHITSSDVVFFDKKILVPFGEFLPFRDFLNFFTPISGSIDYSSGNKDRLIKLKNDISYIPIICYEIIFYWKIINKNNFDSNFIVNITNDLWFGDHLGPYQHYYFTKIRAAEFNKPIIRVSNNGISSVINENGKTLSTIDLNTNGSIKYNLEIKSFKNFNYLHYFLKIYFFSLILITIVVNFRTYYANK